MSAPIIFTCPECKKTFEFDAVGEFEFVPCPICGIEFITVRRGKRMLLKSFESENQAKNFDRLQTLPIEMQLKV